MAVRINRSQHLGEFICFEAASCKARGSSLHLDFSSALLSASSLHPLVLPGKGKANLSPLPVVSHKISKINVTQSHFSRSHNQFDAIIFNRSLSFSTFI